MAQDRMTMTAADVVAKAMAGDTETYCAARSG
jgi:hypothetical protein